MTASTPPGRLTRRADFLACSRGRRVVSAAFVLQERQRGDTAPARFGFTVTKKTGGAVERNRMRRRVREAVRLGADDARSGSDYVLILNRVALDRPFAALIDDLNQALRRAARPQSRGRDAPPNGRTDG